MVVVVVVVVVVVARANNVTIEAKIAMYSNQNVHGETKEEHRV